MKIKLLIYTFFALIILIIVTIFAINKNFFDIKSEIKNKYPNINLRNYLFKKEPIILNLQND